jgi:hypothetical protein
VTPTERFRLLSVKAASVDDGDEPPSAELCDHSNDVRECPELCDACDHPCGQHGFTTCLEGDCPCAGFVECE